MTHPVLKMYDYHVWANGVIIDRLKELPKTFIIRKFKQVFLQYQRC